MNRPIQTLLRSPGISVSARRLKYSKIKAVLDEKYLLDPQNVPEIAENIAIRKGVGDIHRVQELLTQRVNGQEEISSELEALLLKVPNKTHPDVKDLGEEPRVIKYYNKDPEFDFKPHQFQEIAHKNKWFRMEHLSNFTGHKSYYLMGDLAALVFFGLVTVCGTTYILLGHLVPLAWLGGVGAGALVTNILVVNKIRDIESETRAGRKNIPVRWGRRAAEIEYLIMMIAAFAVCFLALTFGWAGWSILIPLLIIPRATQLVKRINTLPASPLFNKLLADTAQLVLYYCVLFSLGIVLV